MKVVCLLVTIVAAVSHAAGQAPIVPAVLDFKTANELMLANSPLLNREKTAIGVSRAGVLEARQRPNPSLDASSESYPVFEPKPGPFLNSQELSVRAEQPIETAAKRSKRIEVARNELTATEAGFDDVVRQLKLELKSRYYAVALAQAQNDLAKELLQQFDEVLKVNEARYKQGEISGLEASRLRIERLRFSSDLGSAELQLRNSKVALAELMGISAIGTEFIVSSKLDTTLPSITVDQLKSKAVANRADLRAQSARVSREKTDINLQKALAVPNVNPVFGYKRDFGLNTLVFGFNLPLPVFNRNQGGVARATAESQRQEFELARLMLQVNSEVQQSFNRFQAQDVLVQQIEQQYLPSARVVRDTGRQSFRLGAIDLVAFIDAERTYREIVRSYNQALFDRRNAQSSLEAAIGEDF